MHYPYLKNAYFVLNINIPLSTDMTIALVSTSDRTGGAALACNSLHGALLGKGVDARFLVRDKAGTDDGITATAAGLNGMTRKQIHFWNERLRFILRAGAKDYWFLFSPAPAGENIIRHDILQSADIIHIHWINSGFLSIQMLDRITSLKKPVLFTLHDMWLFTGGCHHPFACRNYHTGCGHCFMLKRPGADDISRKGFLLKSSILEKRNVSFVTVSSWLKDRFLESGHNVDEDRIMVVPNVIDTALFQPLDPKEACNLLEIEDQSIYIAFGAQNLRSPLKGLDYLVSSLNHLKKLLDQNVKHEKFTPEPEILMFGKYKGNIDKLADSIPFKIRYLGTVRDKALLPAIYSAADITVVPSLYETFGQVAAESLSCGTPAVAFRHSGPTEIIQHGKTGYLAQYESAEDLAEGIHWGLQQKDRSGIREECRQSIMDNFAEGVIADRYLEIYNSISMSGI
jgi:glycosyltransferase involved in cell wall biosynthesis